MNDQSWRAESLRHALAFCVDLRVTCLAANIVWHERLGNVAAMHVNVSVGPADRLLNEVIGQTFAEASFRLAGKDAVQVQVVDRRYVGRTLPERRGIHDRQAEYLALD